MKYPINVRVHKDELEALVKYSKAKDVTLSEAIRRTIRMCFDLDGQDV